MQPGEAASNAIRAAARSLGLDDAHGVRIRLTGPVPLADEEFASLAEDWHLVAAAMVIALLGILWWAVHSGRVVAAILLATFMGLIMTAGLGLLVTGRFNLISVAFIPLFVGLGIDFSIQFSVRFLAERHFHPGLTRSPGRRRPGRRLAAGGGRRRDRRGLLRLPADRLYRRRRARPDCRPRHGRGLRARRHPAAGPAGAAAAARPAGWKWASPGWRRSRASSAAIVAACSASGFAVAVAAAAALPFVRFDFNPLHLKSPKVELMATLADLAADPDWTPNTINVIAPSAAAAGPIAHRLGALPEVSRVLSLASFVPHGQVEKLALIRAAAERLGPALGVPVATATVR